MYTQGSITPQLLHREARVPHHTTCRISHSTSATVLRGLTGQNTAELPAGVTSCTLHMLLLLPGPLQVVLQELPPVHSTTELLLLLLLPGLSL
jgi:hypothetical protein